MLRTLIVLVMAAGFVHGQQVGQPQTFASPAQRAQFLAHPPSESVTPQPATAVTIELNSDLATTLEKARRDTFSCETDRSGKITCEPLFPDLKSVVQALLANQLKGLIAKYPPPSIKQAQDAAAKA